MNFSPPELRRNKIMKEVLGTFPISTLMILNAYIYNILLHDTVCVFSFFFALSAIVVEKLTHCWMLSLLFF